MFHVEHQCLVEILLPVIDTLCGEPIDKVDAHVIHAVFSQSFHGANSLLSRVPSPHPSQSLVVKGLYTHAHPVHPQRPDALDIAVLHIIGIHLHGHLFRLGCHAPHHSKQLFNESE